MNNVPVVPMDKFIVLNKSVFTEYDRKVLTMLYQPILGVNAVNLYLTLRDYLDKLEIISNDFTHYDIMNNTLFSISEIIDARYKLEGIGLIKVYLKESDINNYVYELYSPLTPYDFLNNPVLATSLYNVVGKREYDRLVNYFNYATVDLSEYIDITRSFDDTFVVGDILDKNKIESLKNNNRLDIKIKSNIDINNVLATFPNELLNYKKITKKIKELIINLALIYNFNEEEMTNIIKNSILNKEIDIMLLESYSKRYYDFNNNGRLPGLVYANQPMELRRKANDVNKKERVIHAFESASPYQFLQAKNKCRPTSAELDIVKYLLVNMEMKPGVVNVLLDYVLRINENKLPKKYIETIASQWKKSNIETVSDAMDLASKEYSKRRNSNTQTITKKRVTKEVPKWMENEVSVEKVSKEKQEEFLRKLNSLE